ncbi:unnamed protein product [Protopolystoma xenopodis]|uniref:Uncharacterized protein n=1 Tax=Protopolystoma xenopodis TaxID=117903 RepID=A0A3S5AZ03_9PLAT|nr:unnamed protein product [Protopolystoma xenopodis]
MTDPLDDLISGSSSSDAGQPSRPKTSSTRRPRRLVGLTPLRAPPAKPLPALLSGQPMIVCFIGGCTLAEVAALRFVAERRQWHLMMATTSLLHTRDLIQHVSQAAINKWP